MCNASLVRINADNFTPQIFLTYTPYVNTFFSSEEIDSVAWGKILASTAAIFLVVEVEKVYGPLYIMPLIRKLGMCKPTVTEPSIQRTEADEELNSSKGASASVAHT
jgi:hypothetical protein